MEGAYAGAHVTMSIWALVLCRYLGMQAADGCPEERSQDICLWGTRGMGVAA